MTAKELGKLVKELRNYFQVDTRMELETQLNRLRYSVASIRKYELAEELNKLIAEIDSVDTEELVRLGTFN